jgi:hypothetical protein
MKEILRIALGNIKARYFQRGERDFSYELYHQLRLMKEIKEPVEVTCETGKTKLITLRDSIFKNDLIRQHFFVEDTYNNFVYRRIPDLIIHEYNTRDHQLLAIEIKKAITRQNVLKDLAKLAVYCHGRLKYKKGILILVNADERRVRQFPNVNRFLTEFPELEIWIVRHGQPPIIICRDNI